MRENLGIKKNRNTKSEDGVQRTGVALFFKYMGEMLGKKGETFHSHHYKLLYEFSKLKEHSQTICIFLPKIKPLN